MKASKYCLLFSLISAAWAGAQTTPGIISVLRVGTGASAPTSAATPLFLDRFLSDGSVTNTIAIDSSGASALVSSGTATSEGQISRAPNGSIIIPGYNTGAGLASVANSAATTVPRGAGMVDSGGTYSLAGATTTFFSANNIRGATSDGTTNFWASGANSGTVYLGTGPQTAVEATPANTRSIAVFNGNLCFDAASSGNFGIWAFSGLPTTGATASQMINTGTGSSPYAFALSPDNSTAYIADDRTIATGGGVQKWVNHGGTWTLAYTLGTGTDSTVGARGLAVVFSSTPVIYATTTETTANRLITVSDTGAAAAATLLATAPVNTVYRGVAFSQLAGAPPAITGPLNDQTVAQGRDALFAVTATGSTPLHYLWTSNSVAITPWETNSSLTLSTTNDLPGSFTVGVLVSNAVGTASSSATLTITTALPPPPAITQEPSDVTVNAGGTAVFTVAATGAGLTYQWQLGNTPLIDGPTTSGAQTATLTFSDVFGASAGNYLVVVGNPGGSTNSTPARLSVVDPLLTTQPVGRTFLAGGTISVSVGATGTRLAYQWSRNGAAIADATNSTYTATDAAPSQSGGYEVEISGTYGSVTSSIANVVVAAGASTFFPSNLVVLRLGDGAQTLINSGNTLFLDQFTPAGSPVGTMYLPDTGPSALLVSGVAGSEGFLTRSPDGRFLTVAGYNTNRLALGGSLSSSTSVTVPRGLGTIDARGAYSLAAITSAKYSGDNIRAGVTDGLNNFWGAGSADGTWYFGNTAGSGTVQNSIKNCRVINIENGMLIFSTQNGVAGLYTVGAPTTGPATTNLLLTTGASSSPEDFAMNAAANLVYIADDSSSGGIQRWDLLDGGVWANTYTLSTGGSGGARSLTVDFSGASPVIYAVTGEATASRVIAITDTGAFATPATLATSPANQWYRAVRFSPGLNSFPAPSLTAVALNGTEFSFTVSGVPGYRYVVQASADLNTWQPLQTNVAPFSVTVPNATASPRQFFRAVSTP